MADINRPSFTNLDQTTALENINNLQTGIKQGMQNIVSGDLANASSSLANITDQFNALVDSVKNNNMFEQLKDKIEQTNLMIDEFRIKTEKGIETQEKSIKSMTESLPKVLGLIRDMESSVEGLNKKFGSTAELEKFSSQIMDMKKNFDEIISMPLLDDGTAINSAKKVAQIYIDNMQTAFQMADIGKDIIISSLDNGKEEIANEIKKILSNTQVAMNIVPNVNSYEGSGATGTDLSVFNKLINEISVLNKTTAEAGEKTSKTLEKINAFLEAVDTTKVNEIPAVDKNAESTEVLKEIRQDLKNDGTPKAGDNIAANDTLKDYVNGIKESLTKYSELQNQVSEKAEKVQIAKEKYDEKPIARRKNAYEKANTDLEDTTKQLVTVAKEIIDNIKNYKENISPTINPELTINGENAKEQIENINDSAVQDLTKYDKEIDKIESIKQLLNEIQKLSDEYFNGTTESKAFDLNQISNFANKMNDIEKIFNSLESKEIIGSDSLENSKLLSAEIDKLINSLNNVDLASGILDSINDLDISKYITEKLSNTKIKLSNLLENDNLDTLQVSSLRNTEQTIKSIINNQNLENTTTEDNSYTNKNDIDNKSNLVNNVYQNVENIKSSVNSTYLADQVSGKNEYTEEFEDILNVIKDIERSVSLFQSVKQYANENTEFSNTGFNSSINVLFNNFSKLIEDLNTKTEKVKESSNYSSVNNDMSAINNLVSQYNTPVDNTENNEITNNIENLTRTIINSGSESNSNIVNFRDNVNDINRLFNDLNNELSLNVSLDNIKLDLADLNVGSNETSNTEDIDYINNRNINDITSNIVNNASNNVSSLSSLLNNISNSNQSEENNVNTTNTQNTSNSSLSNIDTDNTINNLDNRQNSNISNISDQTNSNIDNSNINNLNNQNTDISNLNNKNIDLSNVSSLNNHNISDIINNLSNENASSTNISNSSNEVNNLSNISESSQNNIDNTSTLNNQDSSISNVNQSNNESNSSNNVNTLNNIDNSNRENTNLSNINNLSNENVDLDNVSSLNNQNINDIINNLNNESASSTNINNISNNKNIDSNISNNQDNSSINRISQSNAENINNLSLNDISNLNNEDIELSNINNRNISDIVNNLDNQRNINNTDNSNYEDNDTNISNVKNLNNSSNDVNNLNNDITNLSNSISKNINKSNNENVDIDNVNTLNNQNINDIADNLNNANIETTGRNVPSNNIRNLSNQSTNVNNEINNLRNETSNLTNNQDNISNESSNNENNILKNIDNSNNQDISLNNENTNLNNEINNLNSQISNLSNNLSNNENISLSDEVNNAINQISNSSDNRNINSNNETNNANNEISSNTSNNLSNIENTNLNNDISNLNNEIANSSNNVNNLSNEIANSSNNVNNLNNENVDLDNISNINNRNISDIINNLDSENVNLNNIDNSNRQFNSTNSPSNLTDNSNTNNISNENVSNDNTSSVEDIDIRSILNSINNENFTSDNTYSTNTSNLTSESNIDNSNYNNETSTKSDIDDLFKQLQLSTENANYNSSERVLDDILDSINIIQRLLEENPDSAQVTEAVEASVDKITHVINGLLSEDKSLPESQVEYFKDLASNLRYLKEDNGQVKFGGEVDILSDDSQRDITNLTSLVNNIENSSNVLNSEGDVLNELNSVNNQNIAGILNSIDTSTSTFSKNDTVEKIISITNQTLSNIVPELNKLHNDDLLKEITNSLSGIRNEIGATLVNRKDLPPTQTEELKNIINTIDETLHTRVEDTQISRLKENEILRTNEFESSVNKTEEKYNNIIFGTDENNPTEMLSAVDIFIDSLKQSVNDYENLAKSVTDLDLNKIITDKLELMSGTSQVIHDEFHENIDERQSEELTKIINQVNNYRDQKNDYINYANSVDNSNTDNSNNNGGDIINKNIFEKIEDFNDLDLNRILYTATGAKEQLRNTALDMMSGNLTTNSENNSTNIEAIDNIMKDYTSVTNSTQMMQSTINNINSLKEEYDNSEDKAYQDILKTNMENLYGVLIKLAEDINNSLSSTIREKNDLVNDNDNNRDMKGLSISLGRGNNVINQELNKISRNETYESEETNILYNKAFEDAAKRRPMGGKGELDDELGELDKNIGSVGQNLNSTELKSMSDMFDKIKGSSKDISDTSLVNAENLSKYIDNMDVSVDDLNEAIFMLDSILEDNSKQIIDNNQLENTLKLLTNIDNILKNILSNNGTAGIERNLTDFQVNKIENIRRTNKEVASRISNTKSTNIDTDISDAQKRMEQYYSIIHYSKDIFERQKPSIGINALKAVDKIDEITLNNTVGNYSLKDRTAIRRYDIMNDLPGLKNKLLDMNALSKDKSTKQDRISINMTELHDMVEASKKIPENDLEKKEEAAEEIKAKVQSIEELLKSYTETSIKLNETIKGLDIDSLKKINNAETNTKDFSSLYEIIYDSIENDAKANNSLIEVVQRFGMDTDENFIALYNNLKNTSKETADRINSKTGGGILGTVLGTGAGALSGISGILSTIGKGISGIIGVVSSIFNVVGRIFGVNLGISSMVSGTVDYYKKFGQMDVAGTQAQMKQGNIYTPGLLEYNKDVGIELYKRTYGLIGYDEYANQSNNLISQVQGHWGNDQSKVEGQMDMTQLSYPALLLNKVYDVDSTSAIKTFYKDIGMTAQETEAFMYKLVQTAQISNIPVSEYVKTIENLALKFKELGLNAEVADVSIQNLMLQGMDFQTASSMTGEYGSAISRFSQDNARTGFYGVMSGQFDTVWEGMKAARDRWNDDGSVKEGSSEIVAKMIDSELGMYSGILDSNEDYKWTYIQDYFQKLGFSEKNSAILTNKYTSGDMKGFNEFFEQASEEAEDENAVTLVNQDQLEAKLQVAADNTDELTKANSMLQATQMELARVSNNMIDLIGKGLQNTIAALGGIMLKLAEIIAKGVDALSPLLGKLIEHPIVAILAAIAGKLGIKGIGSLLKKAATGGTSGGTASKLVSSLAAGSKTVPILSGVIDAGTSFVGDYFVDKKTAKYSAGSAAGKGVGTAVGAWGGAKAGAAIGTMIAPGVGTAIGTVIGAVAGGAGGHWAGKTATEAAMDSMGVQEYRKQEEKTVNNYNEYNSSGTNYSTNLTGMLTGTSGKQNDYTNAFYQYTGLTPYEIEPYESAFTNTYNIDDLYEIQDTQNNSTNKLLNQYQMSQERMTNLVTEKIEDAIDGKEFRDNGAKIELIAETLQNMGYDRETSYELAEKYVGKDMDGFNQKIKELTETMSDANKKIASNSYTFDTSVAGRGIASSSTTNNHNTTIYNATPQAMERLAKVPGATTDMSSGQYDEVINYIKTNTPRELTRSDIEDTNYQAMDSATRKQAEALTNILNRYEQNSTSTSLTQNFEKFNDDTMSILEKELNKANFANKNYGIELFGEDKEEAIMNLISTTAQDKEGLYELLAQEKYNFSDITDEFNSKFRERIESMGSAFARMNYGQKENAALQAALEVINEILKDTNKQITSNTDALKNAKLKIDTDAINSKLSELGIKTKASDLDVEALENKRALSAIKNQILQQDIKSNITNNQKTEDTLIQKNYAMSSSYMNSVDYVHELVDQYNSVGSGSYSKDLSTYQDNIAKTLSDGFLSNSKKFKDETDLFSTLGNSNETVLQLSSLAVGNKEELYSVLSKVAGNEGKISDLMEKLYSENMYKYREAVTKDGKELQGTAGYEVAVATEVMKDALKKENYLEDNDNDYVKYGTLESLTKNFRTDKLTSAAVSDINFGKQSNVLDNVNTKHESIMTQGKSSSIYGDGTSKLTSEQSLETQEEIHNTLNQQIAESQNQANSVTNNFATIIDKASSEFELLQTIANIGNYILNCLRVTQSYNRNIAEDLEDIARAKVTMKVKTTNKISNSSNDSSKSSGSNKSNKSTGTQNASAGSLENPADDFQFTGGIRGWLAGANNAGSSGSNSNSGTSVMLGGSMGSGSSSGTPMGLREALSKTSSGSSSTASSSGGASHTASTSGGASSTASSSGGGSTPSLRGSLRTGSASVMTSNYDNEPMAYDYSSSPGYSSNPVSAAAYTDSDYGIDTAAYDYESDRSVYDGGGGSGESGLGSINEQMDQWDDLVIEMANKYGMDPALIKSIIYQESGGDPNAQSYAGAMGLMQLMPGTAQEVASQLGWSNYDPYDPRQSVEMGTYYLSNLINTYDLQGATDEATYANALAAYNWGIGNYLNSGQRSNVEAGNYSGLPGETQNYVSNIIGMYGQISNGTGNYSSSGSSSSRSHSSGSGLSAQEQLEEKYKKTFAQAEIYDIGSIEYSNGATVYNPDKYAGYDPLMDTSVYDMQGLARQIGESYSGQIDKYKADVDTVTSSSGNPSHNKQEFNIDINVGGGTDAVARTEAYARAVQEAITQVTKEYYGTTDVIGATIYNSNNSRY